MRKRPEVTVDMKERLKNNPLLQSWFYTQSPLVITRPALRETLWCVVYLICGFLLSCGRLRGQPAPFALAFLASLGGGLRGLTCLLGAAAGYLTMQPFSAGLQMVSAGILIYVCNYIFGSLWVTRQTWFRCLVAGAMTGLVGAIFLVGQRITLEGAAGYLQSVALAGLMPLSYDRLLRGKRRSAGTVIAVASFLLGASAIQLPLGIRVGCVLGVALTAVAARRADLPTTALMAAGAGAALDLGVGNAFWSLVLAAGALGAGISQRYRLLRLLSFAAAASLTMACLDPSRLDGWLTVGLGAGLSLLLPAGWIVGREESAVEQSAALVEDQLSRGQAVLLRLYDAIGADPDRQEEQARNQIFDRSAGKVCRRCRSYEQCWDKDARETYRLLRPVLTEVARRGSARREDFPKEFADRCQSLEELTDAINQELDGIAGMRRSRSRRSEDKVIVSRYLLHLSRLLERNARQLRTDRRLPNQAYGVKLGVSARGRGGSRLSGDRGASFQTEDGWFYVILCDGAGTGAPAAEESLLAVDTLTELLQAGMPPDNAMELLNGMYILRDTGSFSTMDVLALSLMTGQGTLYKWGAAPSYIKSGGTVKQVGSASPPPGLGGDCRPESFRLDLWNGDVLVLISDGLEGAEAEKLIQDFAGDNVKELAGLLIQRAAETGGGDDVTAAVVRVTER